MLKKLMMGTALAALLAVPAFAAQNHRSDYGYRAHVSARGGQAYAFVPGETGAMRRSDQVFVSGHYAGQDPDPNVRLELRRDSQDYNY